jgi:hypothetical protein
MAGERNPHRDGWYLRRVYHSGRLNHGSWAVVLHDNGEESKTSFDNLIPLAGKVIQQQLTEAQDQNAALRGALEDQCSMCERQGANRGNPGDCWYAGPGSVSGKVQCKVGTALASPAPPRLSKLEAVVEAHKTLLDDLDKLMADSYGVAGLHLNGDVAPWDTLHGEGYFGEWLNSIEEGRAALAALRILGDRG